MERKFVLTKAFDKQWNALGLTDDDLMRLEKLLLREPKQAPVIQGTGGLKKLRFPLRDKGKSGGVRVIYVDFEKYKILLFVYAYAKSESDDLSAEAKRLFKELIEEAEKDFKGGYVK